MPCAADFRNTAKKSLPCWKKEDHGKHERHGTEVPEHTAKQIKNARQIYASRQRYLCRDPSCNSTAKSLTTIRKFAALPKYFAGISKQISRAINKLAGKNIPCAYEKHTAHIFFAVCLMFPSRHSTSLPCAYKRLHGTAHLCRVPFHMHTANHVCIYISTCFICLFSLLRLLLRSFTSPNTTKEKITLAYPLSTPFKVVDENVRVFPADLGFRRIGAPERRKPTQT